MADLPPEKAPAPAGSTPRRQWMLTLGVGAGAALAGLGYALWATRASPVAETEGVGGGGAGFTPSSPGVPGGASTAGGPAVPRDLWSMSFASPGGGTLAMAQFRGRPLVFNFWATWCPPCLREMPQLDRFSRQFGANGWQVLGLAADQEAPVLAYQRSTPVSYPLALAGFEGIALSRDLGNEAGGLPFTVVFDANGQPQHRHLGEATFEQMVAWVSPKR